MDNIVIGSDIFDIKLEKCSYGVRIIIERFVYVSSLSLWTLNRETIRGVKTIAFDGDGVVFDGKAEEVYRFQGLKKFEKYLQSMKNRYLRPGPLKTFYVECVLMSQNSNGKLKVLLVTSRAPENGGKEMLKTLEKWKAMPNKFIMTGGGSKLDFLISEKADIYFDNSKEKYDLYKNDIRCVLIK